MASQQVSEHPLQLSSYSKRVLLKTILDRPDGGLGLTGERVVIGGWVKSSKQKGRDSGAQQSPPSCSASEEPSAAIQGEDVTCSEVIEARISPCLRSLVRIFIGGRRPSDARAPAKKAPSVAYLLLNDGSSVSSIRVVVKSSVAPISQVTSAGTSILAEGVLKEPSSTRKRVIELEVENILHIGTVDLTKYPLTKPRLPMDFLRNYSHLRPRTTTVASVTRIRNALAYATHTFCQNHGFLYVNMPVITSTDSMGNGETFQVTTLFSEDEKIEEPNLMNDHGAINLEVVKTAIKEKRNRVQELQRTDSNKEALLAALLDLQKTNELALQMEEQEKAKPGTSFKVGKVDFSEDYFSRQAYLSVSAQLHIESYACALGSVYAFGPTFRTKDSHSSRHLAESWMVELEIAFAELEDAMNCVEDYVKFLCKWILENCSNDMKLLAKRIDKTSMDRLQSVASSTFERLTYTKAVELLKEVADKIFETKVYWGINLTEEHERYLAEEVFKKPVIIYDYPKEVKPFYVRVNDDGKTVSAMDLVLPQVGAVIRGSQKEERIDVLSTRIQECGLRQEMYDWYLDLRRHGNVKHTGFSLGFEQMVMLATGLVDIRDAIPFPRSHGKLTC
ncbi:hypothetical protein MRB53_027716 [Persea americana]|uniref:Uncharacterized protein n=1 Tax=Persea americana TaxID=3435 RepID=A0ACC2LLN0_PERAE|nr:hypothetical protein MRB53_027716 [Persea americana]